MGGAKSLAIRVQTSYRLDAPLIIEEGGKTKNSSIPTCDLAGKSHGWRTLRQHVPGINSLRVKSKRKLFRWKTLAESREEGEAVASKRIRIIGGGLAGPEAALQAAKRGCE